MKKLQIKPRVFIYSISVLLIVSIFVLNAKAHVPNSKVNSECRETLEATNDALLQDEDGILNADEIAAYESCVNTVRTELDATGSENWEANRHDDMFMLECYMNLMNYYDEAGNDENAEHYETLIDEITDDK